MPLSPRMPDLAAFEVLNAVANTGSIGAAGRELGLSQQAVSARIRALEAQVGAVLVTRSPRGSSLSPTGAMLAQWAQPLLDAATRIDAGLASLRADSRAHLTVAASQTIAEQLLPAWLASFRATAIAAGDTPPHISLIATNSSNAIDAVAGGRADVGFIESPGAVAELNDTIVAHDELVVVTAPDHPWARLRRLLTPQELAATPLVAREIGSGTREYFDHALASHIHGGQIATPALEMSSAAGVRNAVLAGAGPAVMSRLSLTDDVATQRLCVIGVADIDLHRPLRAIWLGHVRAPVGAIRDLLTHIGNRTR